MKCSLGISNFFEEISSLSHSVVFLYFFALITEELLSYLSLLFFGTLHSDAYIFPFLLCFSLLFFPPPQTGITMNKASEGDGIPVELFQFQKDNAVKVLHSICQQIWKTQQWPQDWKRSFFIPIPKKGNAKECSNYHTIALISHASNAQNSPSQASAIREP